MALMLLTCFLHLHQLRSWLLFYGYFFSPNHSLQIKMLPKSLQTPPSASGFSCLYCSEAPDSFLNNGKSFQPLVSAGCAVIDKVIKVLMRETGTATDQ